MSLAKPYLPSTSADINRGCHLRARPRGRGYGTRLFAEAPRICRGMGIGIVRVSCAEENTGLRA